MADTNTATTTTTTSTTDSPSSPGNNSNNSNSNNNNNNSSNKRKIGISAVNGSGLCPLPKNGHTLDAYQDSLYVFGGNNLQRNILSSGQLHMFSPATNTWVPLKDGPSRTLHSSIVYKNSLFIFGGTTTQEVRSLLRGTSVTNPNVNDTWEFNFVSQEWSKLNASGSVPTPRDGHSAVEYKGRMIVFGGSDDSTNFCDLHTLDIEKKLWMRTRSEGTVPSPRRLHTCVVWDNCLWVFGGYDWNVTFNDIYKYDIDSCAWSVVRTNGDVPNKRYGHTAVVHKDSMYIFGGYGGGYRGDLLEFNFATLTWTLLMDKSDVPVRRSHAAAAIRDQMFVFGGAVSGTNYASDLWAFEFHDEKVPEIQSTLTDDLLKMLDNPSFYPDVTFKVGSRTIQAHKCILSARCSYFDSLFKSGLKEALTSAVVIEDIGEEVFDAFLKYLYGGPVSQITPEVSFELLTLGEKYMLPHLKYVCENIVLEGITAENAATLLITSETYKCTRLFKACMDFISKNHQQVIKSDDFKSLPQHLLLEVMGVISAAQK